MLLFKTLGPQIGVLRSTSSPPIEDRWRKIMASMEIIFPTREGDTGSNSSKNRRAGGLSWVWGLSASSVSLPNTNGKRIKTSLLWWQQWPMNKPPKYFVVFVFPCFSVLFCFLFIYLFLFASSCCLCLIAVAPPPSRFLTEAFVSLQSSKGLVPLWTQFYRPGTNSSSAVPGTGSLGRWERLVLGGVNHVKPVGPQLQDRWSL